MDHGCYTLIGRNPSEKSYTEAEMKSDLENTSIPIKTAALKELIRMIGNGEKMNNILMTVIRFVMPCQDHMIKKLLFVFWEIFPRYGPDGKLLHEMILVCDNYRRDLQHPNEYIRGCTLRFLCKIKEPELLEPLIPTIQACLDHRHPYVRKNAVLAIYTIYKNFNFLIPDGPEKMMNYLKQETDASCKRNAFIMLTHVSQPLAFEYLVQCIDDVPNFDDILQLVVVELIYKFCHSHPHEKTRFIRCVYGLLQSNSPSVRYEAASTLITLSNAPTAVKAVAFCYINLIVKENDNNVKLIVMDRLIAMRLFNERVIQDMVMDIVTILNSSDFELREKTLEFVSDLATSRTVGDLIKIMVKELLKSCVEASSSGDTETDKNENEVKYRYCLVRTLFEIVNRFPEVIANIVPQLCETLTFDENTNGEASYEACRLLRHTVKRHPENRALVINNLISVLPQVTGRKTLNFIIWLFGEFCKSQEEIESFMCLVTQILGDLPLVENELKRITGESSGAEAESIVLSSEPTTSKATKITADGTYATESAFISKNDKSKKISRPVLQEALFDGDYLPAVVLGVTLVKLYHKQSKNFNESKSTDIATQRKHAMASECMLILVSMINLAKNRYKFLKNNVNPDLIDRLWNCFRLLNDSNEDVLTQFHETSIVRLDEMLISQESERKIAANLRKTTGSYETQKKKHESEKNKLDAPIEFTLLTGKKDWLEGSDRFETTLVQALGLDLDKNQEYYSYSNLSKVHQLTGFSDPVYAEAYVNINQFDIILDIIIVNQTADTLQNLGIELFTLGDLKLVEQPQSITLGSEDFANIKASIKVSSTENGVIFGNIVYDLRGASGESTCIIMNNINIDILEYIKPSTCTLLEYRDMWSEFEWENKVTVNTMIDNLHVYLAHIIKCTNFNCLTPPEAMSGECDYLCVTLYAKSIFGENVLANLCLEKASPTSPVSGHCRIRAKTQGMAVNIGDKISNAQKQPISKETIKELIDRGIVIDLKEENDNEESKKSYLEGMTGSALVDCNA